MLLAEMLPTNGLAVHRYHHRPVTRTIEQRVQPCPRCGANGVVERLEGRMIGGVISEFSCAYGCGLTLFWGSSTCESCKNSHHRIRDAWRCWKKQRGEL